MIDAPRDEAEVERIETGLLLEGVHRRYGYDFRDYARSSIQRRIRECMRAEGLASVSALQARVLHDRDAMSRLLATLSVHVTSMYRDPSFYGSFRQHVVPLLRTYPFTRIWHAGCATGEEVYSMAILLTEEGLYDRCRLYATDMDERVLKRARDGVFPLSSMQEYTANYQRSGGRRSFSEYYSADHDHAVLRSSLRQHIVFAQHNLAMEDTFNEFNVIVCRNVMIYFNRTLQDRVHRLLYQSLARFGVLALGRKENLRFTPHEHAYEALDERERIYRRTA